MHVRAEIPGRVVYESCSFNASCPRPLSRWCPWRDTKELGKWLSSGNGQVGPEAHFGQDVSDKVTGVHRVANIPRRLQPSSLLPNLLPGESLRNAP